MIKKQSIKENEFHVNFKGSWLSNFDKCETNWMDIYSDQVNMNVLSAMLGKFRNIGVISGK